MQKPRQRRRESTQQAILDAARQIISEQGIDSLSMRTIAERIDYSPAGLYEYFSSKDSILQALSTQGHQLMRDQLLKVEPNQSSAGYLQALGIAYIEFARTNPDYYLLMFTTPTSPANLESMLSESSSYPVLLGAIRRGLDAGDFQRRPGYGEAEMAYSAWALVHGIAMLRITYLSDFPLDLSTADRETLETFSRGLRS